MQDQHAGRWNSARRTLLVGSGLLMLTGCTDDARSCELATDAMVMRATVTHDGIGPVEVEIELETASADGPGTALTLCPDADRLRVNGVELEPARIMGQVYYSAEFESPAGSYEVSLEREGHEDLSATIEMPPSFEIEAPLEDEVHARAEALEVSWAPGWTANSVLLTISDEIGSDCIEGLGLSMEVEDSGSYSVPAGTLVGELGESCEASVTLMRALEADYPAGLAPGGSFAALVRRRVPFTSVE